MVQYCVDLLFGLRIVGVVATCCFVSLAPMPRRKLLCSVFAHMLRESDNHKSPYFAFSLFLTFFMGVKLFPKTGSRESRVEFSDSHHSFSFLTWMASFGVNPKIYRTLKKPTCTQYRFARDFSSFSIDRVDDDAFETGESIDRIVQILPFNNRNCEVRPSYRFLFVARLIITSAPVHKTSY